jgi:hypothetical protein
MKQPRILSKTIHIFVEVHSQSCRNSLVYLTRYCRQLSKLNRIGVDVKFCRAKLLIPKLSTQFRNTIFFYISTKRIIFLTLIHMTLSIFIIKYCTYVLIELNISHLFHSSGDQLTTKHIDHCTVIFGFFLKFLYFLIKSTIHTYK